MSGLVVGLVVVVICLILFLGLLGVMREVVILRGEVRGLSHLILMPPEPPYVGNPAPDLLQQRLQPVSFPDSQEDLIALFLSSDCAACGSLMSDCEGEFDSGGISPERFVLVAAGVDERSRLVRRLKMSGAAVIADPDRSLVTECGVIITPSALMISASEMSVTSFRAGVSMRWIMEQVSGAM